MENAFFNKFKYVLITIGNTKNLVRSIPTFCRWKGYSYNKIKFYWHMYADKYILPTRQAK